MGDWTTVEAIQNLTGYEASTTELKMAQSIVCLFADTSLEAVDAGLVSSKNARLMAWAVAYQAVWMSEHPDVFTNVDSSSFSQDGVSSSQSNENAALLAPLALRCIRRLSWNLQPLRAYKPGAAYTDMGTRDSAVKDDGMPWTPIIG